MSLIQELNPVEPPCPGVGRVPQAVHRDEVALVLRLWEQVDLRLGLANLEDRSVRRRQELLLGKVGGVVAEYHDPYRGGVLRCCHFPICYPL